jgi:hypothetical protein
MGGSFAYREALEPTFFAADVRSSRGAIEGSSVYQVSPIRRVPFNHT